MNEAPAIMELSISCKLFAMIFTLQFTRLTLQAQTGDGLQTLHHVQLSDLSGILQESCALLGIPPSDSDAQSLLTELSEIFQNDPHVFIGQLMLRNVSEINWRFDLGNSDTPRLVFYPQELRDRACLLMPPKTVFHAEPYTGRMIIQTLIQFINEKCGAFRTEIGTLTSTGLFHQHIMENLYQPKNLAGHCKRIKMPQKYEFFPEYLFRSRPVIIENAIKDWPAVKKWRTEYLRKEFGNQEIHIKLTPDGNFEGVEKATLWGDYHDDWIPEKVKTQLHFPDLVVVRPATTEMIFSDFLDFITSGNKTYSAYLEYSSIPYYMPKLEEDIFELPFVEGVLERRHLNMWLSDGNTLGKLHFDPYDNFLCQVRVATIECK